MIQGELKGHLRLAQAQEGDKNKLYNYMDTYPSNRSLHFNSPIIMRQALVNYFSRIHFLISDLYSKS